MKVDRPGRAGIAGVSRGRKKSAADRKFSIDPVRAEAPAAPVSGLGPIAAVGALLAAQEQDGQAARRRSQSHRSAGEMLDLLQRVQGGLLLGQIPGADLRRLKTLMSEQRNRESDPKLAQILADIELRAAVELAKLGFES